MAYNVDRVEVNGQAILDLLRGTKMQAGLKRRAELIRQTADAAMVQHDVSGHRVSSGVGVHRADAEVSTWTHEARVAQSRNNNLLRAVDAARG